MYFIVHCKECNKEIHLHMFHKTRIKLKNMCEHFKKEFVFPSYTRQQIERALNIQFRSTFNSMGERFYYIKRR